ncbi:MAG: hypothetical protein ACYSTX_04340 [Planctomycetota bacterium]|jgi:hypothetical protein
MKDKHCRKDNSVKKKKSEYNVTLSLKDRELSSTSEDITISIPSLLDNPLCYSLTISRGFGPSPPT